MTLKFKRVERDCPHNKSLRQSGETRGIIYDFDVYEDGVHIATESVLQRMKYNGVIVDPDHPDNGLMLTHDAAVYRYVVRGPVMSWQDAVAGNFDPSKPVDMPPQKTLGHITFFKNRGGAQGIWAPKGVDMAITLEYMLDQYRKAVRDD